MEFLPSCAFVCLMRHTHTNTTLLFGKCSRKGITRFLIVFAPLWVWLCVCVCAYVCICVGVGGRERVRGCSKGEVLHSLIQKRWHLSFPLLWGNVERFPVCVLWHMILWPRCLYGVVFMSMNGSVLLQITPIGFKIYSVVLAVGSTGNFAPSMWSDKWHVGSRVFLVKRVPRLKQACTEVMYNDAAAHTWQCTIDRACEIWKWNADNWTGGQLDEMRSVSNIYLRVLAIVTRRTKKKWAWHYTFGEFEAVLFNSRSVSVWLIHFQSFPQSVAEMTLE